MNKKNKKEEKKKKTINKKSKTQYPKGQFWFNVVSLTVLIGICLFIGGRSFYYYSKQHTKEKKEANTLATVIKKNHAVVETGNGLHKIKNEYVFKGKELSNYVMYSNRLFRVLKIHEDNSVLLVANDNQVVLTWGDETSYKTSNIYAWLNKQEEKEHTGIFYDSLNNPEHYLTKTPWCEGKLVDNQLECKTEEKQDYVAILTAQDYANALGKNSFLNDETYTWLLGLNEEEENIYLSKTGLISSADIYSGYGVKPLITIKGNIDITGGAGTLDDPYRIEKDDEQSNINRFVKLGEDIWRIQEDNGEVLKLSSNNYLQVKGQDYVTNYSNSTTEFDPTNRKNIGYYLNHTYLNSLSYQEQLSDCTFYTGEMSDEVGYHYLNIYQKQITAKVGMLNLVDLKLNTNLTDYFLMNTTSSLGEMVWLHYHDGELHEAITRDEKKVVPVVCILKSKLVNGNGSIEAPYTVE